MVIKVSQLWFLDTWILKLIYFSTITNEETYIAGGGGGVQRNCVFSRLSQISPRPNKATSIFTLQNDRLNTTV